MAPHYYRLRIAWIRSSQLNSLKFKKDQVPVGPEAKYTSRWLHHCWGGAGWDGNGVCSRNKILILEYLYGSLPILMHPELKKHRSNHCDG